MCSGSISIAVNAMRLARKIRATICPTRPIPTTMTGLSSVGATSYGDLAGCNCGNKTRSTNKDRKGVTAMDRLTTTTRRSASAWLMM